jgi:hypothetical protein
VIFEYSHVFRSGASLMIFLDFYRILYSPVAKCLFPNGITSDVELGICFYI